MAILIYMERTLLGGNSCNAVFLKYVKDLIKYLLI